VRGIFKEKSTKTKEGLFSHGESHVIGGKVTEMGENCGKGVLIGKEGVRAGRKGHFKSYCERGWFREKCP